MLFLIDYDRGRGQLATLKAFQDSESDLAEHERLEMELDHIRRGIEHEVVLFEAESEEALRRTHRRYFNDLTELIEAR